MRRATELTILCLSLCLIVRTFIVQGVFVPFVVPSGSMAPTLLGVHRDVVCEDCGFPFPCEADVEPVHPAAVCPNCGFRGNDAGSLANIPGDRLIVDRASFSFRPVRRWEVVAFRHPQRPSEACVKRVVGLPGESVEIRNGDVYIDGEIQRKPWPVLRAMAVPVHDASFRPSQPDGLLPRWMPDSPETGWQTEGETCFHAGFSNGAGVDWLTYRHGRRSPAHAPAIAPTATETPITDDSGYHQTRPRRIETVCGVVDLILYFRIAKASGKGQLYLRADYGPDRLLVAIDLVEPGCRLLRNGEEVAACLPPEWPIDLQGKNVILAMCDGQVILAVDDLPRIAYSLGRTPQPDKATSRPFSIGTDGPAVEICDLRVFRDVYYSRPPGLEARWGLESPVHLGADEYYVLGDNSPFSEDSRTWPEGPGVAAKWLIGKPLVVHLPMKRVEVWGREFQVPALARIRYIR